MLNIWSASTASKRSEAVVRASLDSLRELLSSQTATDRLEAVEADQMFSIALWEEEANAVRQQVPWGLDRTDQEELPLDGKFSSPGNQGAGIHVYVLDRHPHHPHGIRWACRADARHVRRRRRGGVRWRHELRGRQALPRYPLRRVRRRRDLRGGQAGRGPGGESLERHGQRESQR